VEWDGQQFPPPLGDIDNEWLTTWAEVADRSETPVVVARLNDLLWERKFGERPDRGARTAIDSYLAMRDSKEPMVAPDALVRALELARALRDIERTAEIATLVVDHARASIEGEEWEPGVALILIEAAIELPTAERPEGLDEVLQQVKTRYQTDPYIVRSTTELQAALRRDDPEQEQALHAEAVERFRQGSSQASLAKVDWKAVQMGCTAGLDQEPADFLSNFRCGSVGNNEWFCDRRFDADVLRARMLEGTDRPAANALLTKLDREVTDRAIFLPIVNPHFYDFVSARVKHYVGDPQFGLVVDQASLR
jgi:hypothetical protein